MSNGPILIFDGDCGFCTSSIKLIKKLIHKHPEIKPYQQTDLPSLGISREECQSAIKFFQESERIFSGAQAFAQFLKLSSPPWKLIGYFLDLPGIKWFSEFVYRLIARNRYHLPGGTPACELKDID